VAPSRSVPIDPKIAGNVHEDADVAGGALVALTRHGRRWHEQKELRAAVQLALQTHSQGELTNLTADVVPEDKAPMGVATTSEFARGLIVLQPSNARKLTAALARIGITPRRAPSELHSKSESSE
jgi:hypothetical protein